MCRSLSNAIFFHFTDKLHIECYNSGAVDSHFTKKELSTMTSTKEILELLRLIKSLSASKKEELINYLDFLQETEDSSPLHAFSRETNAG